MEYEFCTCEWCMKMPESKRVRQEATPKIQDDPFTFYLDAWRSLSDVLEADSSDAAIFKLCVGCGASQDEYNESYRCHSWCRLTVPEFRGGLTVGEICEAKRRDPGYPRLRAAIAEEGFTTLIGSRIRSGGRLYVFNGHHRIAAAAELGITEIPSTSSSSYYPGRDWSYVA